VDKPTGKLLSFESRPELRKVNIDLEIFNHHEEVQIRYDLLDCRIDICAPEVLLLFADNFDYQDLRHDFIRGVLTDDVLGNKIYSHVISGDYAARVKCLRTYNAVR
jgi:translation initiation factor eIF-2B subunit epsilon